ncbi:MAG: CaiB/BaiF CoA transferase family protein [Reyranellaceae bacterium]
MSEERSDAAAKTQAKAAAATRRPLEGVKVLEFGHFAAGPFAGLVLADWGADVVKVEPPGGEGLRAWPPFAKGGDGQPDYSLNFASVSRNKRSITADLKNPADLERLRKLAAKADIVIENFRPGVLPRLGLGYEALSKLNPRLVYCSVSGYGQSGPFSGKGAFDVAIQAISGIMSVTGEEDGPPAKCGVPLADFCTAVFAACSSVVALRQAERTGQGANVDCSMLSCMLAISALQTSEFWGTGIAPKRLGSGHPRNAPYEGFLAKDDKWVVVAAGNEQLWRRLCKCMGVEHLAEDPRFAIQADRARNRKLLAEILAPTFRQRDAEDWLDALEAAGVPCAPICDYAESLDSEHVRAIGLVQDMALPNGGATRTVANPIRMSGYEFEIFNRPPEAGEHNGIVDAEWLGAGAGRK